MDTKAVTHWLQALQLPPSSKAIAELVQALSQGPQLIQQIGVNARGVQILLQGFNDLRPLLVPLTQLRVNLESKNVSEQISMLARIITESQQLTLLSQANGYQLVFSNNREPAEPLTLSFKHFSTSGGQLMVSTPYHITIGKTPLAVTTPSRLTAIDASLTQAMPLAESLSKAMLETTLIPSNARTRKYQFAPEIRTANPAFKIATQNDRANALIKSLQSLSDLKETLAHLQLKELPVAQGHVSKRLTEAIGLEVKPGNSKDLVFQLVAKTQEYLEGLIRSLSQLKQGGMIATPAEQTPISAQLLKENLQHSGLLTEAKLFRLFTLNRNNSPQQRAALMNSLQSDNKYLLTQTAQIALRMEVLLHLLYRLTSSQSPESQPILTDPHLLALLQSSKRSEKLNLFAQTTNTAQRPLIATQANFKELSWLQLIEQSTKLVQATRQLVEHQITRIEQGQQYIARQLEPGSLLWQLPLLNEKYQVDHFEILLKHENSPPGKGAKNRTFRIRIRFDLKPLGPMLAYLSMQGNSIHARLVAESQQTTELIQRHLDYFQKSLAKAGLNTNKVAIDTASIPDEPHWDQAQTTHHWMV